MIYEFKEIEKFETNLIIDVDLTNIKIFDDIKYYLSKIKKNHGKHPIKVGSPLITDALVNLEIVAEVNKMSVDELKKKMLFRNCPIGFKFYIDEFTLTSIFKNINTNDIYEDLFRAFQNVS